MLRWNSSYYLLIGGEIKMATKKSMDWQGKMEEFFMKFPALPKSAREVLVKVTPWFALIFGILGVLAGLAGLGILSVLSPFMMLGGGFTSTSGSLLGMVAGVVSAAFLLAAFPGTKARKMQGWNMLFWSEVASVASALLSLTLTGVIFALISFYLLYQIKSYYR